MNLPELPPSDNWFISRNVKSNIDPQTIISDPSTALPDLLNGHLWLAWAPHVLNERHGYGSTGILGHTTGKYSYNVVLTLTPEIRKQVAGTLIYELNASKGIPLSEVKVANQYSKIVFSPEAAKTLLPYAIIHGGDPASKESLKEIYLGEKARGIVMELEGKLEMERTKRAPNDPELPHLSYFSKSGEDRA